MYSNALRCTFFGTIKNPYSSEFVQFELLDRVEHTTYSRNNIGQKCEGNCGMWVLEIEKKNEMTHCV